jgi:hypothetical protein
MGGLYETLSGAKGLRAEGRSAQNIANYQAEVAEQQAEAERLRSGFEQIQQEKEAERIKSHISADIGAARAAGSPVAIDIKLEQEYESELENLLIGYEGQVRSQRLKQQAVLDRLQGQLAYESGKSAARRANIGFGVQLGTLGFLSGFGGGRGYRYSTAGGSNLYGAGGAGFRANPNTGMGF